MENPQGRLILDLKGMSLVTALTLVAKVKNSAGGCKAHSLFDHHGLQAVRLLKEEGATNVWVDYKDLDTPDTVEVRAAEAKFHGADMLTVHASGGPEMIAKAVAAGPPTIIAVTLLTSLTDDQTRYLFNQDPEQVMNKLARWATEGGAHAIVCSARQVGVLKKIFPEMHYIVPGTRSAGVDANDQQQVDTPFNAVRNGADYLVAGRQVTKNKDPLAALEAMAQEISPAFEARAKAEHRLWLETRP